MPVTIRHFAERVKGHLPALVAELDFDERQKAQNRVLTKSGEAVGVFIERGTSLAHGDQLRSSDGTGAMARC
jgi:urease accessory protein UreE